MLYGLVLSFKKHSKIATIFFVVAGLGIVAFNRWNFLVVDYFTLEDRWKINLASKADEVEITRLYSIKVGPTSTGRIDDYVKGRTKVVNGREVQNIAENWRELPRGFRYVKLCFQPAYGLRFRRKGKLLFETTICWNCDLYTLYPTLFRMNSSDIGMGFDGNSKAALALLEEVETQVPLREPKP